MERDRAPDAARPGECFFAEQIVMLTAERMLCADAAHSVTWIWRSAAPHSPAGIPAAPGAVLPQRTC